MSRPAATVVRDNEVSVNRTGRQELERRVQDLDREHPDWSARELEEELKARLPAVYGEWCDDTPALGSRLRSVQRWRGAGARGLEAKQAQVLFPHLWPLGERQRHELEPSYVPVQRVAAGSWRLFLFNCGPEVLREIHVLMDGHEVGYSPFLLMGRFAEVNWQRLPSIKEAALGLDGSAVTSHPFEARFVIAKGTRNAKLGGALRLDAQQGWVEFDGGDGRRKEIE
jgi:hypothetical protein